MRYEDATAQLADLGHELHRVPAHKFDLAHMRELVGALGDPQTRFRSVLIAGTNGKGSTAATLASILRAAGHRTGLYTSPHLVRVNERIRINGEQIGDDDFAAAYERVEDAAQKLVAAGRLPWHPSFFEMLTAMAFVAFAAQNVELAVLEVGMGGRLDATNVVEPLISVITDVSLDHQKFLGETIGEIAREKAGIVRPQRVVVTLPQHPRANEAIGNVVMERGANAVSAVQYVPPVSPGAPDVSAANVPHNTYPLEVMGERITVDFALPGRHQLRNVALAIAAAEQFNAHGVRVTARNVERGIRETRWPGRFQVIAGEPDMVLDVAHNPAGAWSLRSALSERFPNRTLTYVFGVMADKAVREIAQILFATAAHVVTTQATDHPRSAKADELTQIALGLGVTAETCTNVPEALARARALAGKNGLVVVTGSIYIVGEALQALSTKI